MNVNITKKELLPIGTEIITSLGAIEIQRRIGEGFTSVVYLGKISESENPDRVLAIKAFKEHVPESKYKQEVQTLRYLEIELKNAISDFPKGENETYLGYSMQITPEIYDSGYFQTQEGKQIPWIAMEFIEAERVIDIIAEKQNFSEQTAVVLGWQFLYLLHTIHKYLDKTYTDIKIENLFVQNLAGQPLLRVLDVGTLYDLQEGARVLGNPKVDNLKASNVILQLLTGKSIFIDQNHYFEDLPKILKGTQISWGAKAFIKRALHWSEDRRFDDAKQMVYFLSLIMDAWRLSDQQILDEANRKIKKALDHYDQSGKPGETDGFLPTLARDSRILLGVLEARSLINNETIVKEAQLLIDKTDEILGWESDGQIALTYLEAGSYEKAKDSLLNALRSMSYEPDLRRKYYMCLFAVGYPKQIGQVVDKLEKCIEFMKRDSFETAMDVLKDINSDLLEKSPIKYLNNECQMQIYIQRAKKYERNHDYTQAAENYKKAYELLVDLPESDLIKIQETGDLNQKYLALREYRETRIQSDKDLEAARKAYQEDDYNAFLNFLHSAWDKNQENRNIYDEMVRCYQDAIKHEENILAKNIAELGILFNSESIWHRKLNFTLILEKADNLLANGQFLRYVEELVLLNQQDVIEKVLLSDILSEKIKKYLDIRSKLINYSQFLFEIQILKKNNLGDFSELDSYENEVSQELQTLTDKKEKLIDGFLSTVNYLYNIEESDPYFANLNLIEALHINSNENRWILIKKYLADSQKLSQEIGGYRSDDISQWNSIVDNQIAVLSQLEEGTGADALLDTIKSEYEEFQLLTRKSIPQEALRDSYWEYMTDKAKKVLLDLIDFERKYEMGHPYINEMRKEIFHYLDESRNGWNEIYDQAQRHMRTVEDAYMEIKSSFEGGDLDNTVLELVKLDSKHGKKKLEKIHKSLNYRIQQTQEYLEWIDNNQNSIFSRDNPENIYKLFGYISETLDGKYVIPRVYFDKNIESEVSKLYKELQILLTENFKELRNSDEFHIDKVTQLTKLSIRCRKILKIMSEEKNEEK